MHIRSPFARGAVLLAMLLQTPLAVAQEAPPTAVPAGGTSEPSESQDAAEAVESAEGLDSSRTTEMAAIPETAPEQAAPSLPAAPPAMLGARAPWGRVAIDSGSVVGHRGNDPIIDRGESAGLVIGDLIELQHIEHVDLGNGEFAEERSVVARGYIVALSAGRALVELGSNEVAAQGSRASLIRAANANTHGRRPRDMRPTRSVMAPPRASGIWDLEFTGRVFPVSNARGAGFLGDASFTYHGERPFFVGARIDPTGISFQRSDSDSPFTRAYAAGVTAFAGIDHRLFAIGAGFGATRILATRVEKCERVGSSYLDTVCTRRFERGRAGFTFALHGRIGARDGLSLTTDFAFTTVGQSSRLSHLQLRALIPVAQTLAFSLRGGSGFSVTGASWADIGARMRARGDGGAGSLFVTPFLGWSRLSERASEDISDYYYYYESRQVRGRRSGASAGVTVELRL